MNEYSLAKVQILYFLSSVSSALICLQYHPMMFHINFRYVVIIIQFFHNMHTKHRLYRMLCRHMETHYLL